MTDASRSFLFVALTGDEEIRTYSMDAGSGALELAGVSPAHGPIGALTPGPSGDRVYGAHVGSTELSSYRLNRTSGALEHINKVATGHATPALAVACGGGRFLIAGYYTGGGVTVHAVADDGSIGDLVQRVDTGEKAHAVLIDPTERFVFIPHVCPVNKTLPVPLRKQLGTTDGERPRRSDPARRLHRDRATCASAPGGTSSTPSTSRETASPLTATTPTDGTLEIFQTVSTLPEGYAETSHCAHVEVHPNGRWLYASNRGPGDSIAGFEIAGDGRLTPFGHYPVPSSPRSFNIDPSGRFCYCTGEAADLMRCFRVDQESGSLERFGEDIEVGKSPFWTMVLRF